MNDKGDLDLKNDAEQFYSPVHLTIASYKANNKDGTAMLEVSNRQNMTMIVIENMEHNLEVYAFFLQIDLHTLPERSKSNPFKSPPPSDEIQQNRTLGTNTQDEPEVPSVLELLEQKIKIQDSPVTNH